MAKETYTAKDITVLEGLEPVRLRPGMYIGSTGLRGLHHLVYEVVDNSVDEALAGRNDRIEVTLHPDHSVTVQDWGGGIPVDVMNDQHLPALTVVLTKLHAGGKFGGSGYKVSGGLHGVGVSVVNALSEWLVAEVHRDGKAYRQEFARGVPQGDMEVVGDATGSRHDDHVHARLGDLRGARRRGGQPSRSGCARRLSSRGACYIKLVDERAEGKTIEFHYEGGISDFVAYVNESKEPIHRHIATSRTRPTQGIAEVAMQWNSSYQESIFSFANNINTIEGGTHIAGLPLGAHAHAEQVRPRQGPPEGEGGQARGRRRARGPRRRHLGEAAEPAVRGSDERQARQPGVAGFVETTVNAKLSRVPRGEPDRREADRDEGDRGDRAPARPRARRAS